MAIVNLTHSITIDNESVEADYDLLVNVQKRLEYFRYAVQHSQDTVNVGFIGAPLPTVESTLDFSVTSDNLRENSYYFQTTNAPVGNITISGTSYSSIFPQLEGTDKFLNTSQGQVPALYRHKLPPNTTGVKLQSSDKNNNTREVSNTNYIVNLTSGYVFTNLKNITQGEYKIYFVDSVNASGEVDRSLLQTLPVLHEATFEDIDPGTGDMYEDSGAYIVNQSGNIYNYTFASGAKKYILDSVNAKITPSIDPNLTLDKQWFIDVSNGSFSRLSNGYTYHYSINEFSTQNFIPFYPYLFTANELATVICSNLVQVSHNKPKSDPSTGLYIYVIVRATNGVVKAAISNDPNVINLTDYNWILGDIDVDTNSGLVLVDNSVSLTVDDSVNVSYYYEADSYVYTSLDLNPHHGVNTDEYLYVFYLVPSLETGYGSLHYLKVDKTNTIVYASQQSGSHLSSYPEAFVPMNITLENGDYNSDTVVGMKYRELGAEPWWEVEFSTRDGSNLFQYLILAEISFKNSIRPDKLLTLDSRVIATGLRQQDLMDSVLEVCNSQTSNLNSTDSVENISFPGRMALVANVPYTILTDYGGELTMDQVLERIYRHSAAGTYIIPELSGIIPRIDTIYAGSGNGSVVVNWFSEASNYRFNVYVSTEWDGPWLSSLTKVNVSPLIGAVYSNNTANNSYTITGLSSGTKYKVGLSAVNMTTGVESPVSVIYEVESR